MVECPDDGDGDGDGDGDVVVIVWAGEGRCDDDDEEEEGSDSKWSRASVLRRAATSSMPPPLATCDLPMPSEPEQRSSHCWNEY
jgi:hypothetical protein